jgi:phosphopantetheinyl transferase
MNDSSNRISKRFAAKSCDVTPVSARHAARVLYAPISCDTEVSMHCASILSNAELQKRDRFDADIDKARFEQRRAFRRFCGAAALGSSRPLSEVTFEETENGRPCLAESPESWFSFASCQRGLLGAWSTTHAIGVDIEDRMPDLEVTQLARQFFSAAEAAAVEKVGGSQQLGTFYRFWTLKEAAMKSIGEGLPYGLEAFEFELAPKLRFVHAPPDHGGPERFSAYAIEGVDSCAALVIRTCLGVQLM